MSTTPELPPKMVGRVVPGEMLGHYRIVEKIGEGGMGEVYRAHDEHLDCDVALKVLPPGSAGNESARKQFHKEARVLARLNHPNIAIVHDFDTQQGVDYLVMEYVPGVTLSEKLVKGKLLEKEVIRVGTQLAEGLCAAHEHGVVHADLKPANLRLTDDGRLKILDFGLAKLRLPVAATTTVDSLSRTQTITGTFPYMAPEQLLGGEVDARSDIHAAGCVIYEMATGQHPFGEVAPSQLIAAILGRSPLPANALNSQLSAELGRIIAKCLEKEPENRYQSARELAIDLRRLQMQTANGLQTLPVIEGKENHTRAAVSPRVVAAVAGVILVAALSVAYWLSFPLPPPKLVRANQVTNDGRDKFLEWETNSFPLVTDGFRVYFQEANLGIAEVSTAGGETAGITSEIQLMDISPSRSELLVGANTVDAEPPIEVLPLPAGPRRRLGDLRGHDGAWSSDGQRIVFANGNDLYVARRDGAESYKILTVDGAVFWPRWSPDGNRIRFTVRDAKSGANSLWEAGRDGSRPHPLLSRWNNPPAECCGTWSPDGKFYFFQSTQEGKTNIWAVRESRGFFRKAAYAPVLFTTGGMNYFAPVASRDGKQIFVKGAVPRGEVARYDATSQQFVPYLAGISAENLDFSRDGQLVTYVSYPEGTLWRSRIDGRERLQLTFSPMRVFLPRWSPDAKRIAFAAKLPGRRWKVYVISAAGGRPEQMTHGNDDEGDVSWSSATTLVFGTMGVGLQSPTIRAIQVLDLTDLQISTVPASQGLYSPRCSADGRYMAAMPVEQDKLMIYDFRRNKWTQWPVRNPLFPSWTRDGRYLYFNGALASEPAVLRLSISDGKVETVADLKNFRPASSIFGVWSGLAPDDSPLLLRDIGTQEIYALEWEAP